ncbi:MAG TPA: hypothetical protein VHS06_06185 [Chloroflexota bacterium]|nr:hypothetical protein [Chloroflexota bacterium]
MMARSPREFCEAMRDLVVRMQHHPATAVSDQAYEMKLRVLEYLIAKNPNEEGFERLLMERIDDRDPAKELSRGICCQVLNSWRAGSCHYTPEGRLVLRALYPADQSADFEGDDAKLEE